MRQNEVRRTGAQTWPVRQGSRKWAPAYLKGLLYYQTEGVLKMVNSEGVIHLETGSFFASRGQMLAKSVRFPSPCWLPDTGIFY